MLHVLFGSQTGEAFSKAAYLSRCLRSAQVECRLMSLDEFWAAIKGPLLAGSSGHTTRCIIIVSTTGQGSPPSNMAKFYTGILDSSLPSTFFSHIEFSVFGLGDSRYPNYNVIAKRLARRLAQLGAKEFFRLGLGDASQTLQTDTEFEAWLDRVLEHINRAWGYNMCRLSPGPHDNAALSTDYRLTSSVQLSHLSPHSFHVPFVPEDPAFQCRVVLNERITPLHHFQQIQHLQMELPSGLSFAPGDALLVYPQVPSAVVLEFITSVLQRKPEDSFLIDLRDDSPLARSIFPQNVALSLGDIFTFYLDLSAVPDRYFFQVLAHHSQDPQYTAKLMEIAGNSPESRLFYHDYCVAERLSVAEILHDFGPVARTVPLDQLISIIPAIRPRAYSFASAQAWYSKPVWSTLAAASKSIDLLHSPVRFKTAPLFGLFKLDFSPKKPPSLYQRFHAQLGKPRENLLARFGDFYGWWGKTEWIKCYRSTAWNRSAPRSIADLCVACIEFTTRLQRPRVGLCSNYLRGLSVGDVIRCRVDQSTSFGTSNSAPLSLERPLLCISTGTGIAPCRALVQYRYLQSLGGAHIRCCNGNHSEQPTMLVQGIRHRFHDFLFRADIGYLKMISEAVELRPCSSPSASTRANRSLFEFARAASTRHSVSAFTETLSPTQCTHPSCSPSRESSLMVSSKFPLLFPDWKFFHLLATSRQEPKHHVQDVIEQHGAAIYELLTRHPGSIIVVAGQSHPMPGEVVEELTGVFAHMLGSDREARQWWLVKLRKRELLFETWG